MDGRNAGANSIQESPTTEIVAGIAEAQGVVVVAVTVDQELRAALTEMLPNDSIVFADSPEQLLSRPVPSHCAVLIVEYSLRRLVFEQLKSYLNAAVPGVVNIMVGTQNDGSALIGLLSAGHIDRFMVKPFRLGQARNALRSALQEHHSLRSTVQVDRATAPVTRSDKSSDKSKDKPTRNAGVAPKLVEVAQQPVRVNPANVAKPSNDNQEPAPESAPPHVSNQVERSRASRAADVTSSRQFVLPSWSFAFAATIAIAALIAAILIPWRMSMRTPESNVGLDANKVIAGYLSTAKSAFELGSYVDPPQLSAAHFYAAVLELDPKNVQAKQGLDAVADQLINNSKGLIIAGDLLRAQSALDNVRRLQPTHPELAEVTASLLKARETERLTINAAQIKTGQVAVNFNLGNSNLGSVATMTSSASLAAPAVQKPSAIVKAEAPVKKAPVTTQVTGATVATASLTSLPTNASRSVEPVQDETVVGAAPKVAAVPMAAAIEAASPSIAAPINTAPASSPISVGPASISGIARASVPIFSNSELKLINYVPPVYPDKERVESRGGWVDVHFLVTSDGSVINPRIEKGTLGYKFRGAAIAAVNKWKFSPAPGGVKSDQPVTIRMEFRLAN
jgi:protein TonB